MAIKAGLIVLGIVAGILGGLFGIGGGLVMVPALAVFFGMDDKKAVGTSFATILLPVGVFGVMQYWRAGNVDIQAAVLMGIGFAAGSFLGASFANQTFLTKNQFKILYAIFLILVAAKYVWDVFGSKPAPTPSASTSAAQPVSNEPK